MMEAHEGGHEGANAMDKDYKFAKFWVLATLGLIIVWLWICAIASRLITGA